MTPESVPTCANCGLQQPALKEFEPCGVCGKVYAREIRSTVSQLEDMDLSWLSQLPFLFGFAALVVAFFNVEVALAIIAAEVLVTLGMAVFGVASCLYHRGRRLRSPSRDDSPGVREMLP